MPFNPKELVACVSALTRYVAHRSRQLVCCEAIFYEVKDAVLGHCGSHIQLIVTSAYAPASGRGDNPTALSALQIKADRAQPRDRCFVYAELVSRMTDLAGRQFNSGDSVQASQTLKLVQRYAEQIRVGVADDSKKMKDAEVLTQRTSFRLKDILSEASYEDGRLWM
jgi:hypothetical protein